MSIFTEIIKLVYPSRCPCCAKLNDDGGLCEACRQRLTDCLVEDDACKRCGLSKAQCECKVFNFLFSGLCAPYYNKEAASEMIYGFKYANRPYAAKFLGFEMAERFKRVFKRVKPDFVCFVPSLKRDVSKRNYDYVYLLAKTVAKELDVPLKSKAIIKAKANEPQHKLNADQRQSNVKGAYKVTTSFDGKTVLLIDDIKTTGYTLNECAKQLRLAGAEKVYCLTSVITANKSCNNSKYKI